jgi:hypothetical protein
MRTIDFTGRAAIVTGAGRGVDAATPWNSPVAAPGSS